MTHKLPNAEGFWTRPERYRTNPLPDWHSIVVRWVNGFLSFRGFCGSAEVSGVVADLPQGEWSPQASHCELEQRNAEQVKMLVDQRDVMLRLEGDVERLRAVIVNIAASHPGTPVCFERDGQICYQELSNWADYVLSGGYSRAIPPPGNDVCDPNCPFCGRHPDFCDCPPLDTTYASLKELKSRPYGGGPPTEPPKGDKPRGYA